MGDGFATMGKFWPKCIVFALWMGFCAGPLFGAEKAREEFLDAGAERARLTELVEEFEGGPARPKPQWLSDLRGWLRQNIVTSVLPETILLGSLAENVLGVDVLRDFLLIHPMGERRYAMLDVERRWKIRGETGSFQSYVRSLSVVSDFRTALRKALMIAGPRTKEVPVLFFQGFLGQVVTIDLMLGSGELVITESTEDWSTKVLTFEAAIRRTQDFLRPSEEVVLSFEVLEAVFEEFKTASWENPYLPLTEYYRRLRLIRILPTISRDYIPEMGGKTLGVLDRLQEDLKRGRGVENLRLSAKELSTALDWIETGPTGKWKEPILLEFQWQLEALYAQRFFFESLQKKNKGQIPDRVLKWLPFDLAYWASELESGKATPGRVLEGFRYRQQMAVRVR